MLFPRNNDVNHINEGFVNSLNGQVKMYLRVHFIDCEDKRRRFLVQSEYLCPNNMEVTNATTYTHHNRSYYYEHDSVRRHIRT
jgi:hypothetical protein